MCAPRYVHSCVCTHMRRPEDNPGCHFQKCHPSPSRRGLLLAWNSSTRLGWVATKAPSTIFSLPPNLPLPQCRNKSSLRSYKPSASLGLRHPLGSLAIFFIIIIKASHPWITVKVPETSWEQMRGRIPMAHTWKVWDISNDSSSWGFTRHFFAQLQTQNSIYLRGKYI